MLCLTAWNSSAGSPRGFGKIEPFLEAQQLIAHKQPGGNR